MPRGWVRPFGLIGWSGQSGGKSLSSLFLSRLRRSTYTHAGCPKLRSLVNLWLGGTAVAPSDKKAFGRQGRQPKLG